MVQVCWLGTVLSRAASPVLGETDRSLRSPSSLVMASYCLVVADVRRGAAVCCGVGHPVEVAVERL